MGIHHVKPAHNCQTVCSIKIEVLYQFWVPLPEVLYSVHFWHKYCICNK